MLNQPAPPGQHRCAHSIACRVCSEVVFPALINKNGNAIHSHEIFHALHCICRIGTCFTFFSSVSQVILQLLGGLPFDQVLFLLVRSVVSRLRAWVIYLSGNDTLRQIRARYLTALSFSRPRHVPIALPMALFKSLCPQAKRVSGGEESRCSL